MPTPLWAQRTDGGRTQGVQAGYKDGLRGESAATDAGERVLGGCPTPKQLAQIARLKKERNADDLSAIEPSTAEGASWLIHRLKDRRRRKWGE